MADGGILIGYDTPEVTLWVWAADRVPGLFDCQLVGPGGGERFYDLTVGQIETIAHQRGVRIERVG